MCGRARSWLREYDRTGGCFDAAAIAVAAALYVSDFCEARRIVADLPALADDDEQRRTIPVLEIQVCNASGDANGARSVFANILERTLEEHFAFRNLIEGAQIAVVGPAVNKLKNGRLIDAYDLVVRPNFKGERRILAQQDMVGSRTDISYYNFDQYEKSGEEIESAAQQLKFSVFKPKTLFLRQAVEGKVRQVP